MSTFILYIWLITAGAGTQFSTNYQSGWTYGGEYASHADCTAAIHQLGLSNKNSRCIQTGMTQ